MYKAALTSSSQGFLIALQLYWADRLLFKIGRWTACPA